MERSYREHREANANDLHLKYGAHISNHLVLHEAQFGSFLPSFSPRIGLLLSESDVFKLVVESLLGNSNDILTLDYRTPDHTDLTDRCFTLSYTARHMHLKGTTAASLQQLLEWFAALATNIQFCRSFAYGDSRVRSNFTGRIAASLAQKGINTKRGDVLSVREALQATVVDLIASVEIKLCTLDAALTAPNRNGVYTLISLYVSCRSWVTLFQSMSALVKTVLHPSPTPSPGPSPRPAASVSVSRAMKPLIIGRDTDGESQRESTRAGMDHSDHSEAHWQRVESEIVSIALS
jgi:hypothetical protein